MCHLTNIILAEDEIAELQQQIDLLQQQLKSAKSRAENSRKALIAEMQKDGVLAYEQDGFAIKINSPKPSVEVLVEPSLLPVEYQRLKIEADKIKIKKALDEGKLHNMAKLVMGEATLTIKAV